MVLRWLAAAAAFVIVAFVGIGVVGNFSAEQAGNTWALVAAIGLVAAFVAYAAVELVQTGGIASIARQFDTRTIVLMPLAIAINIILGQAVAAALKIPIYLDSIGTILVGALAGPIPGALTGLLANLLWTAVVPPPFHSDIAAAFTVVAAVISAPISANLFGGVTGAGTDFLVAAFRQAGADIQAATLGQGLISDPIDKVVTFFVVYLILNAMARRTKARFPQGERLLPAER